MNVTSGSCFPLEKAEIYRVRSVLHAIRSTENKAGVDIMTVVMMIKLSSR